MRILALDGGGIRGVLTATLLARLEASRGFLAKVDLFAGTSTGGILALGLASGLTPGALAQIYLQRGSEIFSDSILGDVRDLGGTIGAEYSNESLQRILTETFGDRTLASLSKRVVIPTFQLDNRAPSPDRTWKPKFFHNFPGEDSDGDERIVDVALRTSAAPTYFPTYQGYVDGGVVANNPSLAALAQALDDRNAPADRADLASVVLLSVGTGVRHQYVSGDSHDWGIAQWVKPLVSIMLEGNGGVADFQCRQLLGERYARLEPVLPPGLDVELDDASRAQELADFASRVAIDDTAAWLASSW
jgi:patatin-like phospholipase/acyl hydrolase